MTQGELSRSGIPVSPAAFFVAGARATNAETGWRGFDRKLQPDGRMAFIVDASAVPAVTAVLEAVFSTTVPPPEGTIAPDARPSMLREGDYWRITYRGSSGTVRHLKGLPYLARLLARPHTKVAAIDLAYGGEAARAFMRNRLTRQPLMEREGVRSVRNDSDDADEASAWIKKVTRPGGQPKLFRDEGDRARESVKKAIVTANARIAQSNPTLGRHLSKTISTGALCSYEPEDAISWDIQDLPDV